MSDEENEHENEHENEDPVEQEPEREWSQEQKAIINAVTKKNFEHYEANVTSEQKQVAEEEEKKFLDNDEVYMNEAREEMDDCFAQADADGDGRLNEAEAGEFFRALAEKDQAKGKFSTTF